MCHHFRNTCVKVAGSGKQITKAEYTYANNWLKQNLKLKDSIVINELCEQTQSKYCEAGVSFRQILKYMDQDLTNYWFQKENDNLKNTMEDD